MITWTLPWPDIFCTGTTCNCDRMDFGIISNSVWCGTWGWNIFVSWSWAFALMIGCEFDALVAWLQLSFGTDRINAFVEVLTIKQKPSLINLLDKNDVMKNNITPVGISQFRCRFWIHCRWVWVQWWFYPDNILLVISFILSYLNFGIIFIYWSNIERYKRQNKISSKMSTFEDNSIQIYERFYIAIDLWMPFEPAEFDCSEWWLYPSVSK